MDNYHAHSAAESVQNSQYRATHGLLNLIEGLLKAYKDKRKNEHKIEVKVDGKTKFKATVDKTGRMRVAKNDLSSDEILTLQNYFKSIPNPPINPKDFDVMVDGNRVLATKDGKVVEQVQPQQSDAFADTTRVTAPSADVADPKTTDSTDVDMAPKAPRPSSVPVSTSAFEKSVDNWVKTEPPRPSSVKPRETQSDPVPQKEPNSQERIDLNSGETSQDASQTINVTATSVDLEPVPSTQEPEPKATESPKSEAVQLPIPNPTSTEKSPEAVPKVNDTGPIPADYGLGKPISDEAIVATGDRALVAAHGGLEAKRLELNDCVRRGKDPGFSHLNDRATVLRGDINRDLPKFAERLNESMVQGKYKATPTTAPGLDRDMPLTKKKQESQTQSKKQVLTKR
jgi:hypothetical protein